MVEHDPPSHTINDGTIRSPLIPDDGLKTDLENVLDAELAEASTVASETEIRDLHDMEEMLKMQSKVIGRDNFAQLFRDITVAVLADQELHEVIISELQHSLGVLSVLSHIQH